MSEEFKKTVNLKDRLEKISQAVSRPGSAQPNAMPAQAQEYDKVFGVAEEARTRGGARKLERPSMPRFRLKPEWTAWIFAGAAVAVLAILVVIFFPGQDKDGGDKSSEISVEEVRWYAAKLTNGETYYGQIGDVKADPLVMKNVYYDYEQAQGKEAGKADANKTLRLVKRGKEAQGGDGSLNMIRSQVLYLEPLKDDSKILKAVLDYEGK